MTDQTSAPGVAHDEVWLEERMAPVFAERGRHYESLTETDVERIATEYAEHLVAQREGTTIAETVADYARFSRKTFGPGPNVKRLCDHIEKELREVQAEADDPAGDPLSEWVDIIILGIDGAWRTPGVTAGDVEAALLAKLAKNKARTWPDWRMADPDKAIEHDRSVEGAS